MTHKVKGEQLTIYHAHAQRYLEEAEGNVRKAIAEVRKTKADNSESMAPFYDAVIKILEGVK